MGYYINTEKNLGEMSVDEMAEDMRHNPFLSSINPDSLKNYANIIQEAIKKRDIYKIPKDVYIPIIKQIKEDTKISGLTDSSIEVLIGRYLKKDYYHIPLEIPDDMFKRVSDNIASADKIYDKDANVEELSNSFYDSMARFLFSPNSPTLMNAGRPLQQLSGCFVLPLEDSMEGIFGTFRNTALVHKSGGGTGFSLGRIRPKNDVVMSTSGVSSGPVSFMKVLNTVTDVVKQGGTRRGANMAILPVYHPDIMEFIHAKDEEGVLENFNLSVGITENFYEKALKGEDYELINPRTGKPCGKLNAKKVLDDLVESAWKKGDPGIIFLDRLNIGNPTPKIGEIESTNPCGEQPLLPYESCNLGSVNLGKFVEKGQINYAHLGKVVKQSVHFLDNVIDVNKYPLPEIEKLTKGNRKIGFGVMGFADMLAKLGISYNSINAVRRAEDVMSFIQTTTKETSAELAEKRGNFPNYDLSIYKGSGPMRNATVTTIAPTGTISVIGGASSGIEPYFRIAYVRKTPQFELDEKSKVFIDIAKEKGFYSEELMKKVIEKGGEVKNIEEIPKEIRELFITTNDVPTLQHLRIQSAFQKYTDNAVSKTVNLPSDATVENVREVYREAYNLGNLKGITIYRDKSRSVQVLSDGKKGLEGKLGTDKRGIVRANVVRPEALDILHAKKYGIKTSNGTLHITISDRLYKAKNGVKYWIPHEMFCSIKPIGSETSAKTAVGGLKDSFIFQGEEPPYVALVTNLKSVKTGSKVGMGEKAIFSLDQAEGLALEYHLLTNGVLGYDEQGNLVQKVLKKELEALEFDPMNIRQKVYEIENGDNEQSMKMNVTGNIETGESICPQCKSLHVKHAEGCHGITCLDCGYDECG